MGTARRSAALLIAASAALFGALGDQAAAATTAVDQQAWARTGPVPTFVAEAKRLYVAADVGVEQARSFIRVEPTTLPATGATLTLAEATGSTLQEQAGVVACILTSPIVRDGELSTDAAPTADCKDSIPATRATNGVWTLPLDAAVASWSGGDAFGLALVPKVSDAATFRVVFDVAKTAVTGAAAVPRVSPSRPTATRAPAPAPAPPSTGGAGSAPLPAAPPEATLDLGGEVSAPPVVDAPKVDAPVVAAPAAVAPTAAVPASGLRLPGPASSPSSALVLAVVGVVALGPAMSIARRRDPSSTGGVAGQLAAVGIGTRWLGTAVAAGALVVLPPLLSETTVYKLGLILVLLVGAIGLHLLVNWVGELSLAHATIIGFPAFAVAMLSAKLHLSPILLLPVGIAAGAAIGAVVGLPAIRARGLQVALVTLAAGVAIDRFFFTREWFVGPATGAAVPVPTLGPITFATARSLYPVLAVLTLAAVAVAWMLYHSTVVRGMLWVKADPSAAAAFGIPVARYRALAYVLAGGFAGFSGGLTAMWVQTVTAQSFPPSRSFSYLIIVALAGRGFLGGVAAATLMVEGGRLFLANGDALMTYAAPIGLILTLTTYRGGLNGLATSLRARLTRKEATMTRPSNSAPAPTGWRPLVVMGVVAIACGFTAIALAWYHSGNTSQIWVQNQEMISGGLGGLALVVLGIGLIGYDRAALERETTAQRWERVLDALEAGAVPAQQSDRLST
jgi:branched-chain amino acid transport system permease protein